jgi:regulator of replication initiation timing
LEVQRDKAKEDLDKAVEENEKLKAENERLSQLKGKAPRVKRTEEQIAKEKRKRKLAHVYDVIYGKVTPPNGTTTT